MGKYYAKQNPKIPSQNLFDESSTQLHDLGTRIDLSDGRSFIYCKNGAVALDPGKLIQSAAPVADHLNKTVGATGTIGANTLTINVVTTAVTTNQYAGGFVHINDATGEGYSYKIKSHPAADAGATCVLTLEDALRAAVTVSVSEYTLSKHPCMDVVVCPTTLTSTIVGITPIAVTIAYYFWAQVRGIAPVLFHTGTGGAAAVGTPVTAATTNTPVAGAVEEMDASYLLPLVGNVYQVNATTEYGLVDLKIG